MHYGKPCTVHRFLSRILLEAINNVILCKHYFVFLPRVLIGGCGIKQTPHRTEFLKVGAMSLFQEVCEKFSDSFIQIIML